MPTFVLDVLWLDDVVITLLFPGFLPTTVVVTGVMGNFAEQNACAG